MPHATVAGDGSAHLDAAENAAFDTSMRDALQPATTLMSDHDEDGALDPGEALPLLGHHP